MSDQGKEFVNALSQGLLTKTKSSITLPVPVILRYINVLSIWLNFMLSLYFVNSLID